MPKDYPQDKNAKIPYMAVVDEPRLMSGGPMPTVFGVLGATKMDAPTRTLGGLVHNARADAPAPPVMKESKMHVNTSRSVLGPAAKTPMPGVHYGQVPYAGKFMSEVGHKL
jgi:hypothetical protein